MRGIVLFKSGDVEIPQDAGSVCTVEGNEKGGVHGKKGNIHSNSGTFLVQLVRYHNFDSYDTFYWLMNTKCPSLHLTQQLRTI